MPLAPKELTVSQRKGCRITHDNINPNEAKVQRCQAHCPLHRTSLCSPISAAAHNAVDVLGFLTPMQLGQVISSSQSV